MCPKGIRKEVALSGNLPCLLSVVLEGRLGRYFACFQLRLDLVFCSSVFIFVSVVSLSFFISRCDAFVFDVPQMMFDWRRPMSDG